MNFSQCFLYWLVDYLSRHKQYVQIDGKRSKQVCVSFRVPQGFILGHVLFNFHVSDMKKNTT